MFLGLMNEFENGEVIGPYFCERVFLNGIIVTAKYNVHCCEYLSCAQHH